MQKTAAQRVCVGLLALFLSEAAITAHAEPRFDDLSAALPRAHVYDGGWEHFVGGGVAILDCNGDARPDFFVAGGANPASLFVNRSEPGAWRFDDGRIDVMTGVTGAYALDIDSDGHLDLAVLRVGENLLLRGGGDCTFSRANEVWEFDGGEAWTTAFSATWESGNDWPTLAFGNYVDRSDPDGPFEACDDNQIYRPVSTAGYGPPEILSPGFCALSMLISDWQRSGSAELRISNDRHYYVRGGFEEMWRLSPLAPRGDDDGWQRVSLWGMGIASGDLTGDGYPEVMLTSMGDQLLQFNEAGTLRNAPYGTGTQATRPHLGDDGRPSTGWHAEFGDVNNDGLADIFIAKGNVDQMPGNAMEDPNNLLMQQADGTFAEASVAAGIATTKRSRGAALTDLDGDGLLDLVVVNRRAPLELWRNVSMGAGTSISVALRQDGANGRAVGAWVELRAGGQLQTQEVTVGGGHVGGDAGPLHFGIGEAQAAQLRVIWPDGSTGDWLDVTAGSAITVRRGE